MFAECTYCKQSLKKGCRATFFYEKSEYGAPSVHCPSCRVKFVGSFYAADNYIPRLVASQLANEGCDNCPSFPKCVTLEFATDGP
jgi:hypothetical protein